MPTAVELSAAGVNISQKLTELSKSLQPASVGLLQISGFDPSQLADLRGGLLSFKAYLAPGASVEIWSSTPIDGSVLSAIGAQTQTHLTNRVLAGGGTMVNIMMQGQPDMQAAGAIQTQMAADAQKQQMERWKILQETQTKIFEVMQDITVNKAKTADKAFQQWDAYIRG